MLVGSGEFCPIGGSNGYGPMLNGSLRSRNALLSAMSGFYFQMGTIDVPYYKTKSFQCTEILSEATRTSPYCNHSSAALLGKVGQKLMLQSDEQLKVLSQSNECGFIVHLNNEFAQGSFLV